MRSAQLRFSYQTLKQDNALLQEKGMDAWAKLQDKRLEKAYTGEKTSILGKHLRFWHKCRRMYDFFAIICEISYFYIFF